MTHARVTLPTPAEFRSLAPDEQERVFVLAYRELPDIKGLPEKALRIRLLKNYQAAADWLDSFVAELKKQGKRRKKKK